MEGEHQTRRQRRIARRQEARGRVVKAAAIAAIGFIAGAGSIAVAELPHGGNTVNVMLPQPYSPGESQPSSPGSSPDSLNLTNTITAANWETMHANGWDFQENLDTTGDAGMKRTTGELDSLGQEYGQHNVLIGPRYSTETNRPMTVEELAQLYQADAHAPAMIGVYVYRGLPA